MTLTGAFVRLRPTLVERAIVEIKRAIITAAGKSQRTLPLQTLVDRDGQTKTALAKEFDTSHASKETQAPRSDARASTT